MKGKTQPRPVKLTLNKETLRKLGQKDLSLVRGGGDISADCDSFGSYCTVSIPYAQD